MTSHLLHLEYLRPGLRQTNLQLPCRGFKRIARELIRCRCWQCLDIHFAIERQRQVWQADEYARDHVFRQAGAQVGTQFLRLGCFNARMHGVVSHQTRVARAVFACHHHGVAHAIAPMQAAFDLTQFDAEAADLHLAIVTRQVVEVAIRQPARQVAGAIEPRARLLTERVVAEAFSGQFRAVQVTKRYPDTADIDLADAAHRHRLAARVEQIDAHVGVGFADRQAQGTRLHIEHFVTRSARRALGRAVAVEQAYLRRVLTYPAERRRIRPFAAALQHAQASQGFGNQAGIQVEQGGRAEHHRDCMAFEQGGKGCWLKHHRGLDNYRLAAIEQRAPYLRAAGVERRVGRKRHAVIGTEVIVVPHQPHNAVVGHDHALGQACGAGGVDDARRSFACDFICKRDWPLVNR